VAVDSAELIEGLVWAGYRPHVGRHTIVESAEWCFLERLVLWANGFFDTQRGRSKVMGSSSKRQAGSISEHYMNHTRSIQDVNR
jgi:hypothetical protein